MPAVTALGIASATRIQRALKAFGRMLARRAVRLDRTMRNRLAAKMLTRLDDRMLADIGITRADLRDAYAQSPWQDPTSLLRARALERRLARRGVSHGFEIESTKAPPLVPQLDSKAAAQARASFSKCG